MSENPYGATGVAGPQPDLRKQSGHPVLKIAIGLSVVTTLLALLLPATRYPRPAVFRTQCRNNVMQIGLALHNYHDVHGTFPPAYTVDGDGHPLHSWRTLILPYLDQRNLYDAIDFSRPWDDPANAEARRACPHCFRCPAAEIPENHTTYLAMTMPNSSFAAGRATSISEITDGTSMTLLVVEVAEDHSLPWMAPHDDDGRFLLQLDPGNPLAHEGGVTGLLADGSVRFLGADTAVETLRSLITISGGETIDDF